MVGEDLLHAALAVIEVALYSAYRYIFAFLCHHLAFLHIAYALDRIEYHDLRAGNVLESFQRSLTGITGSCNQDHYLLSMFSFFTAVVRKYGRIWSAMSLNAQVGPCHSSSI